MRPSDDARDAPARRRVARRPARSVSCTITNLNTAAPEDIERALLAFCDDLAALALQRYLAELTHDEAGRHLRPFLDGPPGR